VLAQVRLNRIVRVKREDRRAFWQNRVAQENADFVVCDAESKVVAVIELDERSAQDAKRASLDGPMERALRAAGIPFLRWTTLDMPDAGALRAAIASFESATHVKQARPESKGASKPGRSKSAAPATV